VISSEQQAFKTEPGELIMQALRRLWSAFAPAPSACDETDASLVRLALHPLQAFGYAYASRLLAIGIHQGWLDTDVKRICDFGAGTGGPALALQAVFQVPAKNLILLEPHAAQASGLRRLFPKSDVHEGDGLSRLKSGRETYDLISAFMLGPNDADDGMVAQFIRCALPKLAQGGRLLICSDVATMQAVQHVLLRITGLRCRWLIQDELPVTVIVEKLATTHPNTLSQKAVVLPSPRVKSAWIPDWKGELAMEHYCLSTPFEKAYLQATIEAFEWERPTHPAIPAMKTLLEEAD
jgi:hypothetical protein